MFPRAINLSVWARNVQGHRRTCDPPRTAKICCASVSKLSKHRTSDLEKEKKPGAFSKYVSRVSPGRRVHGRCYISFASQHVCAHASLRWHALGSLQDTIHVVEHVHGPLSKLRDVIEDVHDVLVASLSTFECRSTKRRSCGRSKPTGFITSHPPWHAQCPPFGSIQDEGGSVLDSESCPGDPRRGALGTKKYGDRGCPRDPPHKCPRELPSPWVWYIRLELDRASERNACSLKQPGGGGPQSSS